MNFKYINLNLGILNPLFEKISIKTYFQYERDKGRERERVERQGGER